MKTPTQTFRNSVTVPLIAAAVLFFYGCKSPAPAGQDQIQTEVEKVPEAVKPWAYWYWMDDNVSKQGITDDLESMAEIGIKALKATTSSVIDEVESGSAFVVTRRGRPAAVLLPVDEAEDLVLANADEFVRQRRLARADHAKHRTVRLEDLD